MNAGELLIKKEVGVYRGEVGEEDKLLIGSHKLSLLFNIVEEERRRSTRWSTRGATPI
jgi:hypothetical protein